MLLVKGKSHMAHIACTSQQLMRPAPKQNLAGLLLFVWAARYTSRLLVKFMVNGVVFPFRSKLLLITGLLVKFMAKGVVCFFFLRLLMIRRLLVKFMAKGVEFSLFP